MKTFTEIIKTIGTIVLLLAWIPAIAVFLFIDLILGREEETY